MSQAPHAAAHQAGAVIAKIEDILGSVVDDLSRGATELSIPFRTRTAAAASHPRPPAGDPTEQGEGPSSASQAQSDSMTGRSRGVVTFPGRTVHEAKKFGAILRILELSLEALVAGKIITKRNIYYQNTELFREQRVVDALVDDLAFTLGIGRNALNIVAAAKGQTAGPLILFMENGTAVSCSSSHDNGVLIPHPQLIRRIDFSSIRWILVIEKEATFRTLTATQYWSRSVHGEGLLVTGKGFPDLTTRFFLNLIHAARPDIPMYGLVDYDPVGMSILRTYKHGSRRLDHEEDCTVPGMTWLGIRASDILIPTSPLSRTAEDALLPLTARDRRVGTNLLKTIFERRDHDDDEWEQLVDLQTMLFLNVKAEIQAVDNMGDLTDWLEEKMGNL